MLLNLPDITHAEGIGTSFVFSPSGMGWRPQFYPMGGAHYLSVFNVEQLQALALLFLNMNDQGAGIGLIFFGFYALLTGYLTVRSTFLPRILGVLEVFGGFGWLTFLYPPLADYLFPYILALGLLGAVSKVLWLLVFGVNEQRWKEQANAAIVKE